MRISTQVAGRTSFAVGAVRRRRCARRRVRAAFATRVGVPLGLRGRTGVARGRVDLPGAMARHSDRPTSTTCRTRRCRSAGGARRSAGRGIGTCDRTRDRFRWRLAACCPNGERYSHLPFGRARRGMHRAGRRREVVSGARSSGRARSTNQPPVTPRLDRARVVGGARGLEGSQRSARLRRTGVGRCEGAAPDRCRIVDRSSRRRPRRRRQPGPEDLCARRVKRPAMIGLVDDRRVGPAARRSGSWSRSPVCSRPRTAGCSSSSWC